MKKLGDLLHAEIVSAYVGLNIVLINLSVLGVHWLTDTRIKALLAIADVLFGAVVRALVTPTQVKPAAMNVRAGVVTGLANIDNTVAVPPPPPLETQ